MRRSGNGSVVAGRGIVGGAFGSTATLLAPKKKTTTTTTSTRSSSAKKQHQKQSSTSSSPKSGSGKKEAVTSSASKNSVLPATTAPVRSNEQRFFVDSYRAALKELQRADVLHLGNVDHVVRGIFGSLMDVDTLVESGLYRPADLLRQSSSKKSSKASKNVTKKGKSNNSSSSSSSSSSSVPESFMQFNGVAAASHYARYVALLESHINTDSSSTSTLYSNVNISALVPAIRLFFENPALALEVAGLSDVSYLGEGVVGSGGDGDGDNNNKTVENWLEKGIEVGEGGKKTRIADKHELFQATRFRLCLDFIRAMKASTIGLPVNGVYQTRLLLGGHAPTSHHQQQLPITTTNNTHDSNKVSKKKGDEKKKDSSASTTTTIPPSAVYTYPVLRTAHPTESQVVIESMPTAPPGTPKANFESALSVVEDTIPFLKGNDPNNKHVERSDGIAYPRGVVTPGSLSRIAVPRSPTSDPASSQSTTTASEIGGQQPSSAVPAGSVANPAMAPDPFAPPTVPDRFRLGNGLINLCVPIDPFHIQNVIETRPCTLTPITLLIEALAHAARCNGIHGSPASSSTTFYPVVRNSEAVRYMSVPEVQFLPHTASSTPTSLESNAAAKARSIFGMDDKIGKSNINNSDKEAVNNNSSSSPNNTLSFNRVKGVVTIAKIDGVDEAMMDAVKASQLPSSSSSSSGDKKEKKQQSSTKEAKEEAVMFAKGTIGMNILAKQVANVLTHPTLLRAFYPFYAYMSGGISTWSLENANSSTPSSSKNGNVVVASRTLPRVIDRDTGASIASLRDAALVTIPQSGVWYLPTLTIGGRAPSPIQGGIAAHLKLLRGLSCAAFMRDCFVATAASNSRSSAASLSQGHPSLSKAPSSSSTTKVAMDAEAQLLQDEADRWLHTIAVLNGTSPDVVANEKAIALPTKTREYLITSAEEELKKLEGKGWNNSTNSNTTTTSKNAHQTDTNANLSSSAQRTMLPRGGGGLLASGAIDGSNIAKYGPHAAQYFRTQYSPITDPTAFFSRLSSINLANTLPTTTITETNGIVRVTVTTQYMGARDPAEEGDMISGNFTTCDMVTKRLLEKGTHAAASGKRATSDALGLQEGYLHYYQYSVTIQNISAKSTSAADSAIPHTQAILTGRRPSKIALLSRHWVFCDALGFEDHGTVVPSHNNSADNGAASPLVSREMVPGVVREVVGPGVVGNNPILAPGQCFTYDSGVCCKRSDGVYMRGKLQFVMLDDVVEFEDDNQANAASLVSTSSPPDVRENGVVLSTLVSSLPESVVSSAVQMYRMAKEALPTITVHKYFPSSKNGNGKKSSSKTSSSSPSYALRLDMPTSWMRSKPIPEHHFDAHIAATALRADK